MRKGSTGVSGVRNGSTGAGGTMDGSTGADGASTGSTGAATEGVTSGVLKSHHVGARMGGYVLQMAWVCWFKLDRSQGPSGFHSLWYPSVSFGESKGPEAFGFVHPDEIVRAIHLIPRFKFGQTAEYLEGPSKGRPETERDDWKHFNVNM